LDGRKKAEVWKVSTLGSNSREVIQWVGQWIFVVSQRANNIIAVHSTAKRKITKKFCQIFAPR
jgi:hypothetical protein